jgi:hypothetical protein
VWILGTTGAGFVPKPDRLRRGVAMRHGANVIRDPNRQPRVVIFARGGRGWIGPQFLAAKLRRFGGRPAARILRSS